MKRLVRLATVAVLLAVGARPAASEGPPRDGVASLLATLGAMPAQGTVESLTRHPAFAPPEAALRLVGALRHGRGPGAALGLRVLAHRDEPEVRAAALRAIAVGGLRLARGKDDVLDALRSRAPDVRIAGLEALGRVGDARDLPFVLGALEAQDTETVLAAYRALASLTGAKNPYVATRWIEWWEETRGRVPARLSRSLDVLEVGGGGDDLRDARRTVAQYGWIALDEVVERTRSWLRSSVPRIRVEGYATAAALRLGDLAAEVRSAGSYERDASVLARAEECAAVLGVPLTDAGLRPYDAAGKRGPSRGR